MISNPIMPKSGGTEGLHYTKVKAVVNDARARFVYRPPDGGGEYPIEVSGSLAETECQPGSVSIIGVSGGGPYAQGVEFVVTVTLEGETLVLTAKAMEINNGTV